MKKQFNWRWWVLTALFTIGFLALARAFGDPVRPMSDMEWFMQLCLSLLVSACAFMPLYKLAKKWEKEGKIKPTTDD